MELNSDALRYIRYLSFKMDCARGQEEEGWRLDYDKALRHHNELKVLQEEKVEQLKKAMPKVPVYKVYNKPKTTHKKDGTLSVLGERWFNRLKENGYPATEKGPIRLVDSHEGANPNSTPQVKDWLYSLGWKPSTFKFERNKETGQERKIEQVRNDGELCESVKRLREKDSAIDLLDGLTVINHRLGIFKAFLQCATKDDNGNYWLKAEIQGFTNTLRFKHKKPLANLPGVDAPWGEEIRGCLIARPGEKLVGSDMSSLESSTKRHYMWPYDPEYVKEMSQEGFDEHLDLAAFAGATTKDEVERHKKGELDLKPLRKQYKVTNYSAIYGVGPPKLARELGISKEKAKELLDAYWKRNWAVDKLAKDQYVKTLKDGSMWLKNPVSGFYYSLRFEKDVFSTLNQGTGVYCFDTWVMFMRKEGVQVVATFHDEVVISTSDSKSTKDRLNEAISKTNKKLQMNVELKVDAEVGDNYAEVH